MHTKLIHHPKSTTRAHILYRANNITNLLCLLLFTLTLCISSARQHTVKNKETLWSIAKHYKVSVSDLKKQNKLKSDRISIGKKLRIPSKPSQRNTPSKPRTTKKTTRSPSYHTVTKGDTLSRIAKKYNTTTNALIKINRLKNANHITLGQKIRLTEHPKSKESKNSKPSTKYTTAKKAKTKQKIPKAIIVSYPVKHTRPQARAYSPQKTKSKTHTSSRSTYKPYTTKKYNHKKRTIILDPGHGGRDPGAVRYGLREKDLNMKVAKIVAYRLRKLGYRVVFTRTSDYYVSLSRRAYIANKYSNALFISIHFNHANRRGAKGIETFYCSRNGYRLASLANYHTKRRIRSTLDRGIKYRRFLVLRETKHPAILIECGFMSNYYESKNLRKYWWHSACAAGIVDAVRRY